jgi:flagellar protein FliL
VAKEDKKSKDKEEASPKGDKPEEGKDAADGESGGEGEEGLNPPKKKLSPKLLIIIGVVGVLVLGGGVGAALYFTGVIGGKNAATTDQNGVVATLKEGEGKATSADEASEEKGEKTPSVFFPLGDILVNLSGDGKRPNFLKINVSLELANEKDLPALEAMKPRIIDHFQVYLRELRVEDLRGSAGLYRLREELLLRVTEAVQPIRVRDVLFQEMLVQ